MLRSARLNQDQNSGNFPRIELEPNFSPFRSLRLPNSKANLAASSFRYDDRSLSSHSLLPRSAAKVSSFPLAPMISLSAGFLPFYSHRFPCDPLVGDYRSMEDPFAYRRLTFRCRKHMNSFVFPAKIAGHNPAPPYSEKDGHRRRPSYPSVSSPEHFLPPTRNATNALPRFGGSPPRRKVDHFRRHSTHSLLPLPPKTIALCLAVLVCIVISTLFPLSRLFSPRHSPRIVPAKVSTQYVDHAFVPEPKAEPKKARKPRVIPGRNRPGPGQQESRRGSINNPVPNAPPPQRVVPEVRPVVNVESAKEVEKKAVVDEVLVKMAKEAGIQGGRYRGAPLPLNVVPGQLRAGKKQKQRQIPDDQVHDHPLPVVVPTAKDAAPPKRKVMQFGKVRGKAATRAALLLQNRKEAFAAEREVLEEEGSVEGQQVRVDGSGNEVKEDASVVLDAIKAEK